MFKLISLVVIFPFIFVASLLLLINLSGEDVLLIAVPAGILVSILFYGSIGWYGYVHLKDRKLLRKNSKCSKVSRTAFADQFSMFKTSWGRLKYVQRLKNGQIFLEGIWPNTKVPNVKNDNASALLAQIEERKLGVDR